MVKFFVFKVPTMSLSTETEHDDGFEFPSNAFSPSVLVKEDNGKCKRKDIPLSNILVAKAFKGLIQIGEKYDPNDKAWHSQLENIIKRERKRYYKQGMVEIKKKLSEFLARRYFKNNNATQPYENLLNEVKFRNGIKFKNGKVWSITDVATIRTFFSSFNTN